MLIRNKLILRFTLLVVAIQLCFSAFIYYFHSVGRVQKFQHRLEGKAVLWGRVLLKHGELREDFVQTFHRRDLLTLHREQLSIYDAGEHLIFTSADNLSQRLNSLHVGRITARNPIYFNDGELEVVGLLYQADGQPYRILIGGYDELGRQQLEKLRIILLVGNAGTLVLIIIAGWYFADESLKPMSRVVRQVERITASNLGRRVNEGNRKDEIAQLAMTFNRMLSGLEQAFESQKSFVAHASHELRTPLTNVLGTLETSYTYDTDVAEIKRSIGSAMEEIRRIIALTNGLLALTKTDTSALKRTATRFDECVMEALQYCQSKYPSRTVQLTFGFLPESVDEPFTLQGNAQLLTTAAFNLLDNACKYSDGAVAVTLGYTDDSQKLLLTVQDSGIGIKPQELPRIFEPLFRAENGDNRPGYGIGLPMTQKIIRLHGGQITVASEVGRGTKVTVQLSA